MGIRMIWGRIICIIWFTGLGIGTAWAQQTRSELSGNALYRHAYELYTDKKLEAARLAFRQYAEQEPQPDKQAEARYYAAETALRLYHPDAENQLIRWLERYPEHALANEACRQLGAFFYQGKNYEKTQAWLSQVDMDRLEAPEAAEARFQLGYACLTKKDFARADSLFNQVKTTQHKYTAAANYYSAYLSIRNGKFDEGLKSVEVAEKAPTFALMTPQLRTIIHYKKKEYDKAIETGEKALADTAKINGLQEIALLVGESYFVKENWAQAEKNFSIYVSKQTAELNDPLRYRLAFSQFQVDKLPAAIDHFTRLSAKTDSAGGAKDSLGMFAAYYLGVAYLRQGNKPFALAAFDQARKSRFSPSLREQSAFNHAKLLYDLEQFEEAIEALQAFLKTWPRSANAAEANELVSEALLNTNDLDAALAHVEGVENKTPRIRAAWQRICFLKGASHFNEMQWEQARTLFKKAEGIRADSSVNAATWYWLAEVASVEGDFAEARKYYERLLAQKGEGLGDYPQKARLGLAYAWYNERAYDRALPIFQQYLADLKRAEVRPFYVDAVLRSADCQFALKQYDKAAETYQQAIEMESSQADYAWYYRGLVLVAANKAPEARQALTELQRRFPNSRYAEQALFQLGNLELEQSQYNEAVGTFTKLIGLNADRNIFVYSYLKRALAYNNLKEYERAAADFQFILDNHLTHPAAEDAILGLQESVSNTGKVEMLTEYLARFKQANPDAKSTEGLEYETAKSLYFNQKYDKAITALSAYLQEKSGSPLAGEARFYLAESYYRLGKMDQAANEHLLVIQQGKTANLTKSVARVGELLLASGQPAEALKYYGQLLRWGKNRREQTQAKVGLTEAFFAVGKADSAALFAAEVEQDGSAPPDAQAKAALYLGKIALAQGEYEKATDQFLAIVNSARDAVGAEAQYLIGEAQFRQKRYKESIETLFELNKAFANQSKWYDRSFLLIADNYIALDKLAQARYALERVAEKSPNADMRDEAKKRLAKLNTGAN